MSGQVRNDKEAATVAKLVYLLENPVMATQGADGTRISSVFMFTESERELLVRVLKGLDIR